jgi:hypothetical protein
MGMAKAKQTEVKVDAFQEALDKDQTDVKGLYEAGGLTKEEAIARMRRTQDLPESL